MSAERDFWMVGWSNYLDDVCPRLGAPLCWVLPLGWCPSCTVLHFRALPCTVVHCHALLCTSEHCRVLLCSSKHCLPLLYTAVHSYALPSTAMHCCALPNTTVHSCALLSITVHCCALPCTVVHFQVLPCTVVHARAGPPGWSQDKPRTILCLFLKIILRHLRYYMERGAKAIRAQKCIICRFQTGSKLP